MLINVLATIAMCVGILIWVLLFSVLESIERPSLPFLIKVLLGMFIPLMTIFYGFDVTAVYESRRKYTKLKIKTMNIVVCVIFSIFNQRFFFSILFLI